MFNASINNLVSLIKKNVNPCVFPCNYLENLTKTATWRFGGKISKILLLKVAKDQNGNQVAISENFWK